MKKIYNYLLNLFKKKEYKVLNTSQHSLNMYLTSECDWKDMDINYVKYLIKLGADVQTDKNFCLHAACKRGNLKLVKLLVEKGADVHALSDMAIQYAAKHGHLDVVKYLVKKGADIYADGGYPLTSAALYGHEDVVKYLLKVGKYNMYALDRAYHWAQGSNNLSIVKLIEEIL